MHKPGRVLAVTVIAGFAWSAFAHDLHLFATVEGQQINGKAYFANDAPGAGLTVQVFGDGTEPLTQLMTVDDGSFQFVPTARSDIRFECQTDDGHRATFTVRAAELPPSLPGKSGESPELQRAPSPAPDAVKLIIDEAVARHVNPLREQLDRYEKQVRFRDVVGGIGYILGLAGVAAYIRSRQSKPRG